VSESPVLTTDRGEVRKPTAQDVQAAVERAVADRDAHVVLSRGDAFLQLAGGVLEHGDGRTLRRARAADSASSATRAFLRFHEGDTRWGEDLAWEASDVDRAVRRESTRLVVAVLVGAVVLVGLAWQFVAWVVEGDPGTFVPALRAAFAVDTLAIGIAAGGGALILFFLRDAPAADAAARRASPWVAVLVSVVASGAASVLTAVLLVLICPSRDVGCRLAFGVGVPFVSLLGALRGTGEREARSRWGDVLRAAAVAAGMGATFAVLA
jgi:hypothetical protein